MSIGGNKIQGGCPIEDSLFTKILPDFRPIFCPIMADFCKFFQRWEGCSPPQPPVSYAYGGIFRETKTGEMGFRSFVSYLKLFSVRPSKVTNFSKVQSVR